jgi:hypothetical protein
MSTFSGFKCARDGVLISPALLNNRSDASLDGKILSGKLTEQWEINFVSLPPC